MALSLSAYAQDTRTEVNEFNATSNISEVLVLGHEYQRPTLTMEEGSVAYFPQSMISIQKKDESGKWNNHNNTISGGIYRIEAQVRIDGENGTLYVIGENPSLKVDGTNWTFNGRYKADTYSYSVAYSPEIKVVNSALEKVKIDGTGIDVSTSADITGDWLESGKVHWDAATNTLTLNNATLVSKNNPLNFIAFVNDSYVLQLIGNNSITTGNSCGIGITYGSIVINGGGSLNVDAKDEAICFASNATIENCTIESTEAINGYKYEPFPLTIKNANVKCGGMTAYKSITLEGSKIIFPEWAKIKNQPNGTFAVTYEDGTVADKVVIGALEAYAFEYDGELTFYYDYDKATHTGTVYGINDKRTDETNVPAWAGKNSVAE